MHESLQFTMSLDAGGARRQFDYWIPVVGRFSAHEIALVCTAKIGLRRRTGHIHLEHLRCWAKAIG